MSSREQFEAWYKREIFPKELFTKDRGGNYRGIACQGQWRAWQASRQALEIALPSRSDLKYMEYFPDVEGGGFNERAYLSDFIAAMKAAGLRVKP